MSCLRDFTRTVVGLFLMIGLSAISIISVSAEPEIDCAEARRSLEAKRAKLSQYVSSLKAFHRQGDWQLVSALNHKIDQLIQQIREAEDSMKCPESPPVKSPDGLKTVKTDVGKFITNDCRELRNMLINLRRKINVLKRNQEGVLTENSPEHQLELKKALRSIDNVKRILRVRCAVGNTSRSSRNRRTGTNLR
jgi:uncharacterized protein YukE